MIDDFRLRGSSRWRRKSVTPAKRGVTSKGDMLLRTTTRFSQRAEPSPLWWRLCLESRIGHGLDRILRILCDKAKRDCASRVPASPGAVARRTRGEKVEGASSPPGVRPVAVSSTWDSQRVRVSCRIPGYSGRSHHIPKSHLSEMTYPQRDSPDSLVDYDIQRENPQEGESIGRTLPHRAWSPSFAVHREHTFHHRRCVGRSRQSSISVALHPLDGP